MAPRRAQTGASGSPLPTDDAAPVLVDRLGKVRPPNTKKGSLEVAELLPFQRSLLQQLVPPDDALPSTNDAMVIMARGLGLRTVVTTFLKIYDIPEKLVLLVNATPEEERGYAEEVGMRLKVVAYELPEAQREKMYKDGGLFSVTSRILIVDMLKKTIPVHLITGLVVLHAEEVRPTSPEAFIVNLYRRDNKIGFLKAFSDRPEAFTYGISPLQTTLVQLKLREVIILPRFHDDVNEDLQKRKADVVELYQPLTPAMLDIQTAILECMELTLSEVKRSNTYLEIDDLTVENALFSSFDRLVRSQLDPVWHKVGPKTRGLVNDLSTLRKLQDYLLAFDCVRFNQYLETMLSSHSTTIGALDRRDRPAWLGTPAADTIFTAARNRVYTQKAVPKESANGSGRESTVEGLEIPTDLAEDDWFTNDPTDEEERLMRDLEETARIEREVQMRKAESGAVEGSASGVSAQMPPPPVPPSKPAVAPTRNKRKRTKWLPPGVEPVLEAQPKWSLLQEVLDEIETQMYWSPWDEYGYSKETILVMCNSSDTCSTLGDYLSSDDPDDDHRRLLETRLNNYFFWKAHVGKLQTSLRRTPGFNKGVRRPSSSNDSTSTPSAGGSNGTRAQTPAERNGDEGELSAALRRKDMRRGQAPPGKRRRVRGGGAVGSNGAASRSGSSGAEGSGSLFAAATGANPEALEEDAKAIANMVGRTDTPAEFVEDDVAEEAFNELDFREYFGFIANEDLVVVRPYLGDEDDRVLEELRPKYVVLYDPSPAFVRRIEAYRAAHRNLAIRVYFLVYKDSVEEQRYLSEIRREKDAFVRLIEEKGSMAIPHEAEYRPGEQQGELLRTVNTRIGGKQALADTPKVIVDMREFRSSLPGILYGGGFEVIPVTLGIGDYIITPEMAVERKSIPDLMQSFNSGRLHQCELMTAHYKEPILLIEFDEKKSFNLETYIEARPATSTSEFDLRSKLVLLTITFPKLRVIWSSSPYQTVEIFRDLKERRAEPDSTTAQKVGLDEDDAALAGIEGEAGFNLAPQDILRSLPGVNSKNYRYLSSQVENLEALAQLDLNEIQALIGVEPGKQLHGFLHSDMFLA
ncbi:DNA repair protein RAD16 [Rhodotorula sphaerocarpa]